MGESVVAIVVPVVNIIVVVIVVVYIVVITVVVVVADVVVVIVVVNDMKEYIFKDLKLSSFNVNFTIVYALYKFFL